MPRKGNLRIEASAWGVENITVSTRPSDRAAGLQLLQEVLPAIAHLDKACREFRRAEHEEEGDA